MIIIQQWEKRCLSDHIHKLVFFVDIARKYDGK